MTITENKIRISNLDYLKKLSKGDVQFETSMIEIFLSENPLELKKIEKGIQENDLSIIKQTAHKLRSTLPFIGLENSIGKELSDMEDLAGKNAELPEIKYLFFKVKETFEIAAEELKYLLAHDLI